MKKRFPSFTFHSVSSESVKEDQGFLRQFPHLALCNDLHVSSLRVLRAGPPRCRRSFPARSQEGRPRGGQPRPQVWQQRCQDRQKPTRPESRERTPFLTARMHILNDVIGGAFLFEASNACNLRQAREKSWVTWVA